MSYKHLAGRLIETQRSMLGEPAIEIARSTEGITVTDDGTVTGVEGEGRAVVDELAGRYTDMLGNAAEMRLLAAAREFEDELALPPSLGGHADVDPTHRDPATHDPVGPGLATHDPVGPGLATHDPDEHSDDPDEHSDDPDERTPADTGDVDPLAPGAGKAGSTAPPGSETDAPPAEDAHGPNPETGAVSDGGAVESGPSTDGRTRVVSPTPSDTTEVVSPTPGGPGEVVSPTPGAFGRFRENASPAPDGRVVDTPEVSTTAGDADQPVDGDDERRSAGAETDEPVSYERAVDDDSEIELEEPVTVRYTVASDLGAVDDATADLSSVYLLPDGESGWQVPVAVEEAVASAVAEALDCEPAAVGNATAPVDVDRLLATLRGDDGDTVSFELRGPLRGLTITFHHTGALAVH